MRFCPKCGHFYDEHPALSREDNHTEICPECGIVEALNAAKEHMPKIYTAYSSEADMTFIMEDTERSTKVVGFYYGEPDEEATKKFYGKLVAEYEL